MPPRSSLTASPDPETRSTDLSLLHPAVREAVGAVLADLRAASIPLFVFEAFRTPERQAFLYAQGRTRPGRIVTYADAWRSYHQYGLAVDLVFGGPGRWTWDEPRRGMWRRMHEIGRAHGLAPLEFETPHLQLAGTSSAALYAGNYPAGGDESWTGNLNASITRWTRRPPSPPRARAGIPGDTLPRLVSFEARATPSSGIDTVAAIAAASDIARYRWKDRGKAPLGYIQGMALVYARNRARLLKGDKFSRAMAVADSGDQTRDALTWYRQVFADQGMANDSAGADTLRHLFVLLIGLGMRESSGRHCEGRDRSATNTTASTAEAGLFQTSYNARSASPLLPQLFTKYQAEPHGFVDVFRNGVTCRPRDWENFGSGDGAVFQGLSKTCPAFAADFAAIGLRGIRKHWGPVTRKEAEIKPACDAMLKEVQAAVDQDPDSYVDLR